MRYLILFMLSLVSMQSFPCSTMVFPSKNGIKVAKNMDWPFRDGIFIIHPRNKEYVALQDKVHTHPMRWRSRYGSVILHGQGENLPATDGMNEKGLTVSIMMLKQSYYLSDYTRPQLNMGLWSQYLLDNYQSVAEVVDNLNEYQLWPETYHGYHLKFHIYVNDSMGNSAIIEFFNGQPIIYQNNEIKHQALTNSYYQEANQALLNYRVFGGFKALPGDYDSMSRFVRAAAFLKVVPKASGDEQVAYAFSGLGNVAQPPGTPIATQLSMVFDVLEKQIFYKPVNKAQVEQVSLKQINFEQLKEPQTIPIY